MAAVIAAPHAVADGECEHRGLGTAPTSHGTFFWTVWILGSLYPANLESEASDDLFHQPGRRCQTRLRIHPNNAISQAQIGEKSEIHVGRMRAERIAGERGNAGANGRIRTADLRFTKPLLYH